MPSRKLEEVPGMKSLLRTFAVLGAAGLLFGPASGFAAGHGTPDEVPPADEAVCEESGLTGAAYGLCIAFCEANDCDDFPNKKACEVLRENFTRITDEVDFPCEAITPPGDS
jgi:hypothetical protein